MLLFHAFYLCNFIVFDMSSLSQLLKGAITGGYFAGLLYQARGLYKEALQSFQKSLDTEPNHVPSLVSTAIVLRQLDGQSLPVMKSFLTDALRLDRTNPSAWYNLGLVYKSETGVSALEAAECFEAAELLQESAPVEPFR
ncbi:hypothetical protein MTR67_027507 [Solanum verrucosum]|uniref:Uncharacterized protein n=1 Tax=Solanum verrucosum TaxID=315347 RepID=A0AAF0R0U4_SOLVR|nr:hypothetical protein MTR67_027507 [Solanum verrucosum]